MTGLPAAVAVLTERMAPWTAGTSTPKPLTAGESGRVRREDGWRERRLDEGHMGMRRGIVHHLIIIQKRRGASGEATAGGEGAHCPRGWW